MKKVILASLIVVMVISSAVYADNFLVGNNNSVVLKTAEDVRTTFKLFPKNNQVIEETNASQNLSTVNPKPSEPLLEELYHDAFLALLDPYIERAIGDYYSQFSISPMAGPAVVDILSIERVNGYQFLFLVKLEVMPFIGPHIAVGVDRLTISMGTGGEVRIEKFEHIKSFELPPELKTTTKS